MQPNQPQQPGTPPPREYGSIPSMPDGGAPPSAPVQHPNGQYEVVPPPTPNTGVPSGHNPYEFIMNPNTPKKKPLAGGNALLVRVAVVGGGLAVLMILIVVVMSALTPKSSTSGLIAIAERQQEIIRITTAANGQTTGQDTANFVATVNASITSSQQQIIAYLATHSVKINKKVLALDQNPQTDTFLTNAANANNYDPALAQTLTQQLNTYEGLLQTTFKQTSSKSTKQLLQGCYTSASKLLVQAKALSAGSTS